MLRPFAFSLFALALVGCAPSPPAAPTTLQPTQIAERTKPGTVLLIIKHSANVSVPKDSAMVPGSESAFKAAIAARIRANPNMSPEERGLAVFEELLVNHRRYLRPTSFESVPASITSIGSGFFVTPDGYAVTNAHVVGTDEKEMKREFVGKALGARLNGMIGLMAKGFGRVPPEARERLLAAAAGYYVENMSLGEVRKDASLLSGVGQPGLGITSKPIPVEIVKTAIGEPIPGKDVAVVKASGENFPTLSLGDDKGLTTGEEIYPYGFPADATFYPSFDPSSATEPSFTRGVVSARKTMKGGWEVIQTDAAIRGGNSGGPVLDEKGEVVGLATFGLVNQKTGGSAQGANFVVPTTIVKELLGRANVTPKESLTTRAWIEAQNLLDAGRFKEAQKKLEEVETLRPGLPAVAAAKSRAASAIRAGKDASPSLLMPLAIGGGLLAVAAIGAVAFLAGRRKAS